jgi:hypothetical protein
MKLIVRPIPDISLPVIDSRTAVIRDPSPFIQGTLASTSTVTTTRFRILTARTTSDRNARSRASCRSRRPG